MVSDHISVHYNYDAVENWVETYQNNQPGNLVIALNNYGRGSSVYYLLTCDGKSTCVLYKSNSLTSPEGSSLCQTIKANRFGYYFHTENPALSFSLTKEALNPDEVTYFSSPDGMNASLYKQLILSYDFNDGFDSLSIDGSIIILGTNYDLVNVQYKTDSGSKTAVNYAVNLDEGLVLRNFGMDGFYIVLFDKEERIICGTK